MNSFFRTTLQLSAACILMSAGTQQKYTVSKEHTVIIHGTSNLHDWDETVGLVSGTGTADWSSDGSFTISKLTITIGVKSIKSDKSAMDNNTFKALKADKYPEITLVMNTPVNVTKANGNAVKVNANLTIAGVTKPVEITAAITADGSKKINIEGSKSINMTDFGIDPPKALLGTLKTGDAITIHFKTAIAPNN